ncbi:MAG: protein phosphatase 2C domain-containing protein [archaeon]|nr:protein phosphatase 2C domain-containing protein [archaeon]
MSGSPREPEQNAKNQQSHQMNKKPNDKKGTGSGEKCVENYMRRNLPELKLSKIKPRLTSEQDTKVENNPNENISEKKIKTFEKKDKIDKIVKEVDKEINKDSGKEEGGNKRINILMGNLSGQKRQSHSQAKRKELIFPQISKARVLGSPNRMKQNQNGNNINLYVPNYNSNYHSNFQKSPQTANIFNLHKVKPGFPSKGMYNKEKNKSNKAYFKGNNVGGVNNNNIGNENTTEDNLYKIDTHNYHSHHTNNLLPIKNTKDKNKILNKDIKPIGIREKEEIECSPSPPNQKLIEPKSEPKPEIKTEIPSSNTSVDSNTLSQKSITEEEKEKTKDSEQDEKIKELDAMTERLNMLQSLFNSLNSLNSMGVSPSSIPGLDSIISHKPPVELTESIMKQEFKNFTEATVSVPSQIPSSELIKAYAYITSQGNVRDYNEDTITAKLINDFFFFAVYDGHGGNGCSIFLRDYLHTYIQNFSTKAIKDAIDEAENTFEITKALNSDSTSIIDASGSCGVMTLIKGNKCIIANVGDSRLVVFKSNKVDFYTEDHKPNSDIEKARIEKAGGKLYQTQTLFPLYQNGVQIEPPWRVLPGRLSVSRTFGDIEAKNPKFGGMKGVVAALPDITEIEITEDTHFICLACDGIYDVLSNEEILECAKMVLREYKNEDISKKTKEIANMVIKAAMAKDSFDNISCVIIAFNLDNIPL